MNILVFSDSHGNVDNMVRLTRSLRPDAVFHLGDLLRDARALGRECPQVPMAAVPGNCDGWTMQPAEKCIALEGKTVLMSHGHTWGVKSGYGAAIARARKMNADILLFGHTHRAYCEQLEDGLWVMNPGTARSSYGVITIQQGQTRCWLEQMP